MSERKCAFVTFVVFAAIMVLLGFAQSYCDTHHIGCIDIGPVAVK